MQIFSYKKRYDFVRYDQISAIHCPMTNFYLQLTAKTPTVRKQICTWALIIFPASVLRKARQWMAANRNNMSWHLPITKPKIHTCNDVNKWANLLKTSFKSLASLLLGRMCWKGVSAQSVSKWKCIVISVILNTNLTTNL